jgi:hypothetical protein
VKRQIRINVFASACAWLLMLGWASVGMVSAAQILHRTVDLQIGQAQEVFLSNGTSAHVKLLDLRENHDDVNGAVRRAEVQVEVNGQVTNLTSGTYHLPGTIGAVQIAAQPQRRTVSLDGTWQIAEGKMEHDPAAFERAVPVPGLVSLATPAFADPPGPKVANRQTVPQKDPKRDAFWYRRSFQLDQPVPAVAVLKIHKAMFGSRVILNGQVLGDHLPSFKPGYFNAQPALKTGPNELLIRVGADRDAVGPAIPSGFDFEMSRDGQNWTDIHSEDNCKGGISDIRFNPVEARHVRVFGTKRGTQWGHAIRELQVFE